MSKLHAIDRALRLHWRLRARSDRPRTRWGAPWTRWWNWLDLRDLERADAGKGSVAYNSATLLIER
jgi:hypothetical protein